MSALDGPDKQEGLSFQPSVISYLPEFEDHDCGQLEADSSEIIDQFFQLGIAGLSAHETIPGPPMILGLCKKSDGSAFSYRERRTRALAPKSQMESNNGSHPGDGFGPLVYSPAIARVFRIATH
jgi:hypothetical protein